MRRPLLADRLSACRRAGLTVQAVSLSPIAILNACHLTISPSAKAASPLTVLVIQGPAAAEWIVSTRGSLQVVPVASNDPQGFWQDVASVLTGLQAQDAGAAGTIHVVGPPEAVTAAQQALPGQSVQRVDVSAHVGKGAGSGAPVEAAVGLALHGLGAAAMSLNLLADSQRQVQSNRVRRIALAVSAAGLTAAVALSVSGMLEVRSRRSRALESLEKRERLYQTLRSDVRVLLQRQARIEQRGAQLAQLVQQGPVLTQVLGQMADTLPDDMWLTSVDVSKSGLVHGVLEGRAKSFQDVTRFFEQLKTAVGMTTVKPLSTTVTTDPQSGKESIAFGVQAQRPLQPETTSP